MAELPKYIMLRKVNETKTGVEYQVVEELPTQSNASNVLGAMTNADRIRAMTDEELATWISSKTLCLDCPRYETDCSEIEADDCGNFAWLTWLKQEADE